MKHPQKVFARRLLAWHKRHGRHDLPWQQTTDPYRVWLAEIMLQQTQVATVIPYYQRFLARYPSLEQLAAAPLEEVMALWSGLGYYARARNLHRCAQTVVTRHGGKFPSEPERIALLPGIGRSTAHAIAAFCSGAHAAILDGNVKRVLCRVFGIEGYPGTAAVEKRLWALAGSLLPHSEVASYIQAQMDFGATLCTPRQPTCLTAAASCPLADICSARSSGRIAELPARRARKPLPQRRTRLLLLVDGDRILLERRPPSGIWGGLLSLPELADSDEPKSFAAQTLGCELEEVIALQPLKHSFTHFQLTLLPLAAAVSKFTRLADAANYCWLARKEIDAAALPTPVRKILRAYFTRVAGHGGAPELAPEPAAFP